MASVDTSDFTPKESRLITEIVANYEDHQRETAERFSKALLNLFSAKRLAPLIHSMKGRSKDPTHLRDKLERKMRKCKDDQVAFDITPENLPQQINDLAGVRLLHLHTSQFAEINRIILELLGEENWRVVEGPTARYWDIEYKATFEEMVAGIKTEPNDRMYTSVHYIVDPQAKPARTAEIQVRTLAEELWGEVDHSINYPHKTPHLACKEQIKVLARVTSSCTRLVDSIYRSKAAADEMARLNAEGAKQNPR